MIPLLSLIIGSYVIVKMLDTFATKSEPDNNSVLDLIISMLAIVVIFITIGSLILIFLTSSEASSSIKELLNSL